MEDTGADAGTPDDTGAMEDTGTTDSGSAADAGSDAGSETDTGMMTDTGPADVGTDAGPADTGTDTGPADTGVDAGPMDAGSMDAGGGDVVVVSDVCAASTEVCNGRDDDCDGVIDENGCGGHLLITEFAALPDEAEMVEIYNPTSTAIDLSDVYLSDVNTYSCVVTRNCLNDMGASPRRAVTSSDFVARFPAGAMIRRAYVTISLIQSGELQLLYGRCPDFYLRRSLPDGRHLHDVGRHARRPRHRGERGLLGGSHQRRRARDPLPMDRRRGPGDRHRRRGVRLLRRPPTAKPGCKTGCA
ncbi:MAG: hypothetical protein R3A52_25210 [Polyangiales bacterium]